MRVKLTVLGIVQGVGFRPFVYRTAVKQGLVGYVRNRGDAGVEILVEGNTQSIERFMTVLVKEKPPRARIEQIKKMELEGVNQYSCFSIFESAQEGESSGSIIPADIAVCNQCLGELRDAVDRRYEYFFITCTDCGPRFTIIDRLPYDRENTAMHEFALCNTCREEYKTPMNRRFHTQTMACAVCGPQVYLTTNKGEPMEVDDPVREAGKLLSRGKILAIKGYGGFHIAASTKLEAPLLRLRETKHRQEKPFAVMAKSLEAAERICEMDVGEQQLLVSPQRPIVLLSKKKTYDFSGLVAPNLHNIGVMLPYTALHYMLFDQVEDDAFVMTSANPANQPIVKDNAEALKVLGETVDYFLVHNRRIAHRCDDSVVRVHNSSYPVFLRRSRGYAPEPIGLKHKARRCVVGLGGELNNTVCVLNENRAFISQHIGDVESIETQSFLQEAFSHLQYLTNTQAEVVACDLHPKFTTTQIAKEMAKERGLALVLVQHHYAHASALMAEQGLDSLVAAVCDGYGYGLGGEAWGGEILHTVYGLSGFSRPAHLEAQPLLGGDLASCYPLRMAAGILGKAGVDVEAWLIKNSVHLPHGEVEATLIADQLTAVGRGFVETTSCGRVLDAAAAVLGICFKRSYEGEPALKLESAALLGRDVLNLEPVVHKGVLDTTQLIEAVYEGVGRGILVENLAHSVHAYLGRGLAELAIQAAEAQKTRNVGLTGGAACNQLLAGYMRQGVEAAGLDFYVHKTVPAGDGGISLGQVIAAAFS
ncbi:MAG: carbamoyltransferase HypF [Nitrososphaerota archaeon]|nr:carbamoyltransferase HypF [Nitrososphaerota archaeon]